MPTPEQQPKFFLDRSLGRVAVPSRLRTAGWDLVALAEHYGMPHDEQVADTQWIRDAAMRGWPIHCCHLPHTAREPGLARRLFPVPR